MKSCMPEPEDTYMLFWGLMLPQQTVVFLCLEKAIPQKVWVKNGKTLRQSSTEAEKDFWGEALGTTPVISPKSDFREHCQPKQE